MPGRVTEMLTLCCCGGTSGAPVDTGWLNLWTPVNIGDGPCGQCCWPCEEGRAITKRAALA